MNTEHNQRSKDSETKMEQAFFDLIKLKKDEKMTVKLVCELAQVNRSTFYAHYLDLTDLSDHIQAKNQAEVVAMVDETLEPDMANFSEVMKKLFEFVAENSDFYSIYLAHHNGISLIDSTKLQQFAEQMIQSEIAKKYQMTYFIAGLGALLRLWLANGRVETPAEMAQLVDDEYRGRIIDANKR